MSACILWHMSPQYAPDICMVSVPKWSGTCPTYFIFEPRHDKTNKMSVHLAKTQISLGISPVWSESSLCAQRVAKDPSFLHADSEDSDQTGRMPRLIWVFAGRTTTLLVLSCHGTFNNFMYTVTIKRVCIIYSDFIAPNSTFLPHTSLSSKVQHVKFPLFDLCMSLKT